MKITIRLEPIGDVYRRYRFTWFDAVAAVLIFGVPCIRAYLLFRAILQIRKSASLIPQPT
jgi:hypothetical protein